MSDKRQTTLGKVLCYLGMHKWRPAGKISIDWRSKWEAYEVCQGVCERCHTEVDQIRRDYYW